MRRKYFGLAIAALATLGPMQAWGGDREIAEQIIKRLKTNRDSGALQDFTLDMKVDKGVVLFRGNVSEEAQRDLLLRATDGIEGITQIVDEVSVTSETAKVVKPKAPLAAVEDLAVEELASPAPVKQAAQQSMPGPQVELAAVNEAEADFSLSTALAAQAQKVMPGEIRRTAAVEPATDEQIVSAVVSALNQAKQSGHLKGFGLDVKSHNGVLQLTGRAGSASQRDSILRIAESVPGVAGVREAIAVPTAAPNLPRLPQPPSLTEVAAQPLRPADQVNRSARRTPATAASAPVGLPVMNAPYRTQAGAPTQAYPVQYGAAPIAGQPVPMGPTSAVGAPRYDSPNLPNYAWPGYSAHPNYAALTYPQQYSPSAWPYIGPFYPYPQVPLGWRKVSLEWDDGWWLLDFTDR